MKHILKIFFIILLLTTCLFPKEKENKKYEFEVSFGLSMMHANDELYYNAKGIDSLIDQYTRFYGTNYYTSGEFCGLTALFPFNFSFNYNFSKNWFIKFSLEYGSGNTSSGKNYYANIQGVNEKYQYDFDYKTSYFMPSIGIETLLSSFRFYANAGLTFTNISYDSAFKYSENYYWHKKTDSFKFNKCGFGISVGIKYMIKILEKTNLFIKLEHLYLKINSLNGEKLSAGLNSMGENFSKSTNGTAYTYETNPYNMEWFNFWDIHESSPTSPWIRNVKELGINFSCVRIMVGFSF
ncbi:MAG: hypothetical protein IBX60_03795 [Candidatus Aminicenantes bacterium]|nr:hypothetical protein [Candidatus Aminicenantes bacterium]